MSIQGNINQMIGIGAALASQTAQAEAHKEQVKAERELKGLHASGETLREAYNKNLLGKQPEEREIYLKTVSGMQKRGAELNVALGRGQEASENIHKMAIAEGALRRSEANRFAQQAKQNKLDQKEEITAYIKGVSNDMMRLYKGE